MTIDEIQTALVAAGHPDLARAVEAAGRGHIGAPRGRELSPVEKAKKEDLDQAAKVAWKEINQNGIYTRLSLEDFRRKLEQMLEPYARVRGLPPTY